MHDASHLRKRFIDLQMGRRIGRRFVMSFYPVSLQVHNHHVFRLHSLIVHAAGLDDEQAAFTVDPAYIAPGKCYQPVFGKQHIGFIYFLF